MMCLSQSFMYAQFSPPIGYWGGTEGETALSPVSERVEVVKMFPNIYGGVLRHDPSIDL